VNAAELQHGSWTAARQQQQQQDGLVVPLREGRLSDEVGANATAVYSIRAAASAENSV
jgi:hypothetical protein